MSTTPSNTTPAQLSSMELSSGKILPKVLNLRKSSDWPKHKELLDSAITQAEYQDVEWQLTKTGSDSQCHMGIFAFYISAMVPAKDARQEVTLPPFVDLNLGLQAEWSRKHIFMKKYSIKNKTEMLLCLRKSMRLQSTSLNMSPKPSETGNKTLSKNLLQITKILTKV